MAEHTAEGGAWEEGAVVVAGDREDCVGDVSSFDRVAGTVFRVEGLGGG
jgi:hypothetical protein